MRVSCPYLEDSLTNGIKFPMATTVYKYFSPHQLYSHLIHLRASHLSTFLNLLVIWLGFRAYCKGTKPGPLLIRCFIWGCNTKSLLMNKIKASLFPPFLNFFHGVNHVVLSDFVFTFCAIKFFTGMLCFISRWLKFLVLLTCKECVRFFVQGVL